MYARRYAIYGALFGAAFPVIGTLVEAMTRHGGLGLDAIVAAHRSALVWIIGTAPLFLGVLAHVAGRQHDRVVAAERLQREAYLRAAGELARAAEQVGAQAQRIRAQAADQTASASQQAAAIAETTSSATAVARISVQTEEQGRAVIDATTRAEDLFRAGRRSLDGVAAGLDQLGASVAAIAGATSDLVEHATHIGKIADQVKDLSGQSEVLALNASIEASRAGERGDGFAAVATEMRRLSAHSHAAGEQVRGILVHVLGRARGVAAAAERGAHTADEAVAVARAAAAAIDSLSGVVGEAVSAGREIADGAREQRAGLDQIVAAMADLSATTSGTVDGATVIEAAAGALADASRELGESVRAYRNAAAGAPTGSD